jgi:hypothetical protein
MEAKRGVGALGLTITVSLFVGCTRPPAERAHEQPQPETATLDDLRAADALWHRVPATITYRTERQRPGLPASAHQCLRGFVDEREDIPHALRMCDPAGVVTLVWDPPTRWRIDVSEGETTTTAIVVGDRGVTCDLTRGTARACRTHPAREIARTFPFHELIAAIATTSREMGVAPDGPVTVRIESVAGSSVRCYQRRSEETSVTWCFAPDGALLSMAIRTEGRGPTIAVAETVTDMVDGDRFARPLAG